MNFDALLEVEHPLFVSGIKHGWKVHTRPRIDFVSAWGVNAQILMQRLKVCFSLAVPGQVHGEHPPARASAEGSMIGVMIKYDQIPGVRFECSASGEITRGNTEKFLRIVRIDLLGANKMLRPLATWDDPQTTAVASQWIKVERDLTGKELSPVAVRVPAGITRVIIAVAAGIVEILAQDATDNAQDARVVQQRAQPGAMFDGTTKHRALASVMRFATPEVPDGELKLFGNPSDLAGREQSREPQITKGIEEIDLLFGEFHDFAPIVSGTFVFNGNRTLRIPL